MTLPREIILACVKRYGLAILNIVRQTVVSSDFETDALGKCAFVGRREANF